jgi:hypothetical protein
LITATKGGQFKTTYNYFRLLYWCLAGRLQFLKDVLIKTFPPVKLVAEVAPYYCIQETTSGNAAVCFSHQRQRKLLRRELGVRRGLCAVGGTNTRGASQRGMPVEKVTQALLLEPSVVHYLLQLQRASGIISEFHSPTPDNNGAVKQ